MFYSSSSCLAHPVTSAKKLSLTVSIGLNFRMSNGSSIAKRALHGIKLHAYCAQGVSDVAVFQHRSPRLAFHVALPPTIPLAIHQAPRLAGESRQPKPIAMVATYHALAANLALIGQLRTKPLLAGGSVTIWAQTVCPLFASREDSWTTASQISSLPDKASSPSYARTSGSCIIVEVHSTGDW